MKLATDRPTNYLTDSFLQFFHRTTAWFKHKAASARSVVCKPALPLSLLMVFALGGCSDTTTTPPAPVPVAPTTLSVTSASVIEGNAGLSNLNFTVTLNAVSATAVSVDYATADGTALSAGDYNATAGTLTIPSGANSGTILVPVVGDTLVEMNETFTLTLSNPVNSSIVAAVATGTIINDDTVGVVPSLSVVSASVIEGNAGLSSLTFTVALSTASASTVTVNYATADGTALAASDYATTSGTLIIPAGATTGAVLVPVNGDTTVEADETLMLTLSAPANATLSLATATGTIINDDVAAGASTLSVTSASVIEGNAGLSSLNFTVTLNAVSATAVSVDYATTNGTALNTGDYSPTSGTLSIPAGATSGTVLVPVIGETLVEPDETFTLTLSNPLNASIVTAVATGTIINDDFPTVSVANVSVGEGSTAGTTNLNFTLTLSAATNAVSVDYATSDGTALAASDYTAANATATIAAGATTAIVTVLVNADTLFEPNETLTLTLSNPGNATLGTVTATGTIQNDDAGGINDTGISLWGDAVSNTLGVTQALFPVQDADVGRDANGALNSGTDGKLGFVFTKLDAAGAALANQTLAYGITQWFCVSDAVTGLTWEVKIPAAGGGIHDANNTYTWFNSTGVNDGGNAGTADPGTGATCNSVGNCDTEKYVAEVNVATLCGNADWRLPTREELRSIQDLSVASPGPPIDTGYFPNTVARSVSYWSSSPSALNATLAYALSFDNGNDVASAKSFSSYVRLVRGGL